MLLDGAMGTELSRRGYGIEAPLWGAGALIDAPELVERIHGEYVAAGAQAVTTNSFGLSSETSSLAAIAVERARTAGVSVVGSIGPADPKASPSERASHYRDLGEALARAGADVLFAETQVSIAGAQEACACLRDLGLPVWIALSCAPKGHTLAGEALDDVTLDDADIVFIGCSEHAALLPALEALAPGHPRLGVKPSLACTTQGRFEAAGARETDVVEAIAVAHARFDLAAMGGCCGTTPAFTALLRERLA